MFQPGFYTGSKKVKGFLGNRFCRKMSGHFDIRLVERRTSTPGGKQHRTPETRTHERRLGRGHHDVERENETDSFWDKFDPPPRPPIPKARKPRTHVSQWPTNRLGEVQTRNTRSKSQVNRSIKVPEDSWGCTGPPEPPSVVRTKTGKRYWCEAYLRGDDAFMKFIEEEEIK